MFDDRLKRAKLATTNDLNTVKQCAIKNLKNRKIRSI